MTVHSAWLPLTGQSRVDTRLALSAGMTPAGSMMTRAGVVPDGGFALQSTSAMQCQITAGRAWVQGLVTQGAYPIAVDAAVPLTVSPGDPQYPRIDLVVLRVQDDQFDGSGLTQASVTLIPGTPAAAPVAPAVPQASLALWQIAVPANASAGSGGLSWSTAVTDLRVYTSALGGIVPAGTAAWAPPAAGQYSDLNGVLQRYNGSSWSPVYDPTTLGNLPQVTSTTRPANPPVGKQVYETDTGRISVWTGSAWVLPKTLSVAPQTVLSRGSGFPVATSGTTTLNSVNVVTDGSTQLEIHLRWSQVMMSAPSSSAFLYISALVDGVATDSNIWMGALGNASYVSGGCLFDYVTPAAGSHTIGFGAQTSYSGFAIGNPFVRVSAVPRS